MSRITWGTVYFIRPVADFDKDNTDTTQAEVLTNSIMLTQLRFLDHFVVGTPIGDKGFDSHDAANKERYIPFTNVSSIDVCEDEDVKSEFQ